MIIKAAIDITTIDEITINNILCLFKHGLRLTVISISLIFLGTGFNSRLSVVSFMTIFEEFIIFKI